MFNVKRVKLSKNSMQLLKKAERFCWFYNGEGGQHCNSCANTARASAFAMGEEGREKDSLATPRTHIGQAFS